MAVKNVLAADSIVSLIYTQIRGEYRGYKIDLLTEEAHDNIKKFIFCRECEGISRKPRIAEGKTFCTPCSPGAHTTIVDSRIDEIVSQLKTRCPLSTRGCNWLGQLGDIPQHMCVCVKLRAHCVFGCGEVLERCETNEHLKKCSLRREQCEYCGEGIEVSGANRHIALCPRHPDGEVSCPYKELGCDVSGMKRNNTDTHLIDSYIGHQKLMLREIHRLRDAYERKECDDYKKLRYLKRRDVTIHKWVWMLLALAVLGIAILVSHLQTEKVRIDDTIQVNAQSLRLLMSNATYLNDYIQDRGKTLQGVEWAHRNVDGETYYGPIFYLGTCKLRLHVLVHTYVSDDCCAKYYVTRLRGDYDDVTYTTCHITYTHLYTNIRGNNSYDIKSSDVSKRLAVGDEYDASDWYSFHVDTTPIWIIRIYFDFE